MRKKIVTNTSDQFAHQHKTANQIASSEPFFVGFSPYNTLVVGAQPAVSRFLFRQAVFCAATVRSIISLYKLVAAVNSRIFIATLSFAAKAFSILNKGPNHLKSKLWNFNPSMYSFFKLLCSIFQQSLLMKLHIHSEVRTKGNSWLYRTQKIWYPQQNSLTFFENVYTKINP